jgi:hypothetical protein
MGETDTPTASVYLPEELKIVLRRLAYLGYWSPEGDGPSVDAMDQLVEMGLAMPKRYSDEYTNWTLTAEGAALAEELGGGITFQSSEALRQQGGPVNYMPDDD